MIRSDGTNSGRERLCSGVGHHQCDAFNVGAINNGLGAEVSFLLWSFVVQQVISEGATTKELASASCFEPLGGSFAGLQLGHCSARTGHKQQQYVPVRLL